MKRKSFFVIEQGNQEIGQGLSKGPLFHICHPDSTAERKREQRWRKRKVRKAEAKKENEARLAREYEQAFPIHGFVL